MTKICFCCGDEKSILDFSLRKEGLPGRQAWCKPCMNGYSKAYYRREISKSDFKFECEQREQVKQARYEALKPK